MGEVVRAAVFARCLLRLLHHRMRAARGRRLSQRLPWRQVILEVDHSGGVARVARREVVARGGGLPGLLAVLMIVLRLGRSLEGVPVLLSVFGISFFAYNLWQSWLLGMFCLLFFVFSGLISGPSKRRQVSKT